MRSSSSGIPSWRCHVTSGRRPSTSFPVIGDPTTSQTKMASPPSAREYVEGDVSRMRGGEMADESPLDEEESVRNVKEFCVCVFVLV